MRYAPTITALIGLFAISASGCSGSATDSAAVQIRCGSGASFCIISCDLGCSQTGCSVTEIAENQRLKFTFSSALDVGTVNGSSISIRTSTGVAPEGDLMVSGNLLTFVPRVRTLNGISTFGFLRNESYVITIAGGSSAAFGVRDLSGDSLTDEFTCIVYATRGIVDEDQRAPTVEMISPGNLAAAPRDPTIILRFSELIDTTPLRGTLTAASPVRVTLRTATQLPGGGLICNAEASGLVLEGIPRLSTETVGTTEVTVMEFKPTVLLPGLACIEVVVTADLRDLSGRAAVPNRFEFFTIAGNAVPITVSEPFSNASQLDVGVSSGTWGPILPLHPNGGAHPGLIGGDGRHGSFDYTLGTPVTSTEYIWDTTSIIIPMSSSLTGLEYTVTDGKFYFTDMLVPAGVTITFTGPVPPQIRVRGKADIQGTLRVNGAPMTTFNGRGSTTTPTPHVDGQPGGLAGAGGGEGGRGGNECQGTGPIIVAGEILTNGANGEDVKLLAGHGYFVEAANTGGRGSGMNPPTGIAAPNSPLVGFVYRAYFASGGAGGGFSFAGGTAAVTPIANLQIGPIVPGGILFALPSVLPAGAESLNHFTVGGSGGGGGGTHAFGTIYVSGDVYTAGSGGSGGGGALALRAGGDLTIAGGGLCEARGGAGAVINGRDPSGPNNVNWGVSSPGGGGSGGSFLLQSGADLTVGGTINTTGGNGSRTQNISTASINVLSTAGAGSVGSYRVEAAGALNFVSAGSVPTYDAARHSGPLVDRDDFSGCTSLWYATNQVFPPAWLRYELEVDTDGDGTVDITYTDTGDPGTQTASDPNGPLRIQFQGAQLQQSTGLPLLGTEGPWRSNIGDGAGPGIGLDSPTGFRFMMTFNRGLFPDTVVVSLRVYARA